MSIRLAKTPLCQRKISSCERVRRFLPAIFSVRQPLKTPPELVTLQLGEPNSETPTPASPPQRNRSSMLRSAYPPGGTVAIVADAFMRNSAPAPGSPREQVLGNTVQARLLLHLNGARFGFLRLRQRYDCRNWRPRDR
jgi:hypothetical protein